LDSTNEFAAGMYDALKRLRSEAAQAASVVPQNAEFPIVAARERATKTYEYFNRQPPNLASVENVTAQGAYGQRMIRMYRGQLSQEPQPVLLYAHGGGWIVGNLDLEDWGLRYMAQQSNACIISLDYCLAPEYQYPKPVEDVAALAQWVRDNAAIYNLDKDRIAIAGASAGANLALASSMMLRDLGEDWLACVLSFYGVFDTSMGSESHRTYAVDRYSAGAPDLNFFLSLYLADESERTLELVHLVGANLSGLPPVHIHAAELDVLRDDSLLLANRLRSANVPHSCTVHAGAVHGFTVLAQEVAVGREALKMGVRQIEQEWGRP